jgi:hypothetical protein
MTPHQSDENDGLPSICVVDTNVPKLANRGTDPDSVPPELATCVLACIEAIDHVVNRGRLALDAEDEIFDEYRRQLDLKGQPGVGDQFVKWVHDKRWTFPESDRVRLTKTDGTYEQFPTHEELADLDPSDRKFVAVADAHPDRPPILEAADSKWWGWREALAEAGTRVQFLCSDYVRLTYRKKMER